MEQYDKKEARGLNDDNLGEVQQILPNDIVTTVGVMDKESYCIPKKFLLDSMGIIYGLIYHKTSEKLNIKQQTDILLTLFSIFL